MKETPGRNSMRAQFIIAAACLAHALVLQLHGDNVQPLTLEFRIAPDAVLVGSTNRFRAIISGGVAPYNCEWYCDSSLILTSFGNATAHELYYIAPDDPKQATMCFAVTDSKPDNPQFDQTFRDFWQVRITLKRDGVEIPASAPEVLPGQQMNLSAEIQPVALASSPLQWSLPGRVIKTFDPGPGDNVYSSSVLEELTSADYSHSPIIFYWTDGSDPSVARPVALTLTIGNSTLEYQRSIRVKKPAIRFRVNIKSRDHINCDRSYFTPDEADDVVSHHYGRIYNNNESTVGFYGMADFSDEGGIRLIQLVENFAQCTGEPFWNSVDHVGYDGTGLHSPYPHTDSPAFHLPWWATEVNNSSTFYTYLMFKPLGANAIYVPIKCFTWVWHGTSLYEDSLWWVVYSFALNYAQETSEEPTWSHKYPTTEL